MVASYVSAMADGRGEEEKKRKIGIGLRGRRRVININTGVVDWIGEVPHLKRLRSVSGLRRYPVGGVAGLRQLIELR